MRNGNGFFRNYKIFFLINLLLLLSASVMLFIFPDAFGPSQAADRFSEGLGGGVLPAAVRIWLFDMIPVGLFFFLGITIYMPAVSPAASWVTGAIFSRSVFAAFDTVQPFFAAVIAVLRLFASLITICYAAYSASSAIKLYPREKPFAAAFDLAFFGKYLLWFVTVSGAIFLADLISAAVLNL